MFKELILTFIVALVLGAFLNGMNGGGAGAPAASAPEPATTGSTTANALVSETTATSFDQDVLQNSETPVLVDFYSNHCAPCREMAPVIDKLAGDYVERVKFVKIDVDGNEALAARFGVNSIPTVILFKQGERQDSFTGLVPREILASAINKTLQ